MSICLINIFILVIASLRNQDRFIKHFDITTLTLFLFLIVFRTLFNFELDCSIDINSEIILPKIIDFLRMPLYPSSKLALSLFLLFIWIIGSCIAGLKAIFIYYKFKVYLKNIPKFSPSEDLTLLKRVKAELHTHKDIKIYRSDGIPMPIVVGITKFSIYLPNITISKDKLRNILVHEVNHVKYHDNFKKIIILLFRILFWWNPFIYLLDKDMDHILEIQCDMRTVSSMNYMERKKYLEDILDIIRITKHMNKNKLTNNFQVSTLYNNDDKFKQRFNLVLDHNNNRKNKKYNLVFCFTLVAMFISSYMFTFKSVYYPDDPNGEYFRLDEQEYIYDRDTNFILEIKNEE